MPRDGERRQDRDERGPAADREAQEQQERGLRQHHRPDVAGAVADGAQQARARGAARRRFAPARRRCRACRAAGRAPRASGTWRCRCSRRGGRPRAGPPPARRRSRSPRGATRARPATAASRPGGVSIRKKRKPSTLGNARRKWCSLVTSSPCSRPGRSAPTTRTRTPVSPSVHTSPTLRWSTYSRAFASAITGIAPASASRARSRHGLAFSSLVSRQALLEVEAPLSEERRRPVRSPRAGRDGTG